MIDTLNHWADPWAAFMLRGLLDTMILLAVVALLWLILRRRASAQLGYWLFMLVLFKLIVPVPISVPTWLARLSPTGAVRDVAGRALPVPASPTVADDGVATTAPAQRIALAAPPQPLPVDFRRPRSADTPALAVAVTAPATSDAGGDLVAAAPAPALSWRAGLMLAWAAVNAVLLACFLRVQWATRRLLRTAVPLDPDTFPIDLDELGRRAGLRRPVQVFGSAAVASPAVGGLLRPRLIVPLDLPDTLPPGQLSWVLLHELAHIRRGDLWLALLQRLLQIAYFFNPAVWLVNRVIDRQREYACDDTALALSAAPRRDCGAGFLSIVERVHAAAAPAPLALGLFHDQTFLRRRLMRILDKNRPVRPRLSAGAAAFLVTIAVLLLPSMYAEGPRQPDAAKAPPASVADDIPIQGRFLDLQGKPVAGVKVSVRPVQEVGAKDWDRLIAFLKEGKPAYQFPGLGGAYGSPPGVGPVTTDRGGHFRLTGIGRHRIVELNFEGDGIESSWVTVLSNPGRAITSPPGGPIHFPTVYAATFEHIVRPDRPIVGTVRDKQSGKPVAGIQVSALGNSKTVSDADGHYELRGTPKAASYGVVAYPAHGEPYFIHSVRVADQAGLGPITADLELIRGIPVQGKLLDRATGKAVHAQVNYFPLTPNANVRDVPGYGAAGGMGAHSEGFMETDGTFHCVVLPGPGFLGVRLPHDMAQKYRGAAVDVRAFFKKGPNPINVPNSEEDLLFTPVFTNGVIATSAMPQSQFQAIVLLNPARDAKPFQQVIYLEPAPVVTGTIVDPDGKPLSGVRVRGLTADWDWSPALQRADFSVEGLNLCRPRRLYFQHDGKHLTASAEIRGDEKAPLTVHMQRAATVTGRLVDADGQPVAHAQVYSGSGKKPNDPAYGSLPENFQTDADGRFRIAMFLPGLKYNLIWADQKLNGKAGYIFSDQSFRPGEARDLGKVQAVPFKYE